MNQILVREKLYVTPELKRKKKLYKLGFILSIFLICILFSSYIYAYYDRNKSEEVSQMLLENDYFEDNKEKELSLEEKMLIISITEDDVYIIQNTEDSSNNTENSSNNAQVENPQISNREELILNADKYVAPSGDTYSIIAKIRIPKINLEYNIISKCTPELLKMSPCAFWGVNPNEIGNFSIAGHNYHRKGKFFSDVPNLTNGDIIEITDLSKTTVQYSVFDKFEVDPKDTSCTYPETDDTREITLITCNRDNSKRVIVKAREVK